MAKQALVRFNNGLKVVYGIEKAEMLERNGMGKIIQRFGFDPKPAEPEPTVEETEAEPTEPEAATGEETEAEPAEPEAHRRKKPAVKNKKREGKDDEWN